MRLARQPGDINLAAVVEDCEESAVVIECLADDYAGNCPLMPQCELRKALRDAQKAFMDHLRQFSLRDLIASRSIQQVLQPLLFDEAKN
jgi:Rrf2 family nitric oxide-sensitive transcriptional repressor